MKAGAGWKKVCIWIPFLVLLVLTCVLSFQSGSSTKELDKPILNQMSGLMGENTSEEWLLTVIFYIRQVGRAGLFWLLGFSGEWAAGHTFRSRRAGTAFICALLLVVSYLTEKLKIFIEGRHYAFGEFVESLAFALLGCLCAALAWKLLSMRKKNE